MSLSTIHENTPTVHLEPIPVPAEIPIRTEKEIFYNRYNTYKKIN